MLSAFCEGNGVCEQDGEIEVSLGHTPIWVRVRESPAAVQVYREVAERYGLWVEKLFWGRKYMGVERTTYIIGPSGKIVKIFPKVNPEGHAAEVQAFLKGSSSR